MAPQHQRSDAGILDMIKKSIKVLPLSGKVCMPRKKHSVSRSLVLSMVSGICWGSWNASPVDEGGIL